MEILTGIITDAEVLSSTQVVLDSKLPDTDVNVTKSITAEVSPDNYVLSSGGMYGAGFTGAAPTWLLDAIQQELTTGTGSVLTVLQGMQTLLDSLQLGVNQNITQIESTILSQAALETSVLSQINANEAAILNLATTRVTATEAQAVALQVQQSTFGLDATAFIGGVASTYVDAGSAIAQDVSLLTTELNGISASISEVALLTTEVVINPDWVDDGLGTDPDALGHPKYITRAIAKKELVVDADGVITGYIAESGAISNFQINADNFSVRATGQSVASQNPFTVNATTGKISFNGVVDFTSTNAVGTTTIDGGKITTGSITAGQIAANTITADKIQAVNINGYMIEGAIIKGASIEGSVIKSSWIDYTTTGDLTNWQFYTPATIPSAYVANFAHNNVTGALIVDNLGYVRLPGMSRMLPVYTSVSNGTIASDQVYPYGSYTINTIRRVISSSVVLTFTGETIIYSGHDALACSFIFNKIPVNVSWANDYDANYGYYNTWPSSIYINGVLVFSSNGYVLSYSTTINSVLFHFNGSEGLAGPSGGSSISIGAGSYTITHDDTLGIFRALSSNGGTVFIPQYTIF